MVAASMKPTTKTTATSPEIVSGALPGSRRPAGPRTPVEPSSSSWAFEYPFSSQWLNVGSQGEPRWLHYVDEGPKDAPVLVFLHGNPTWSFYWRKLIIELRDRYRCIAPDHLGMGLSDRPQDARYLLRSHIDHVDALLHALGVERYAIIGHDWGGCIGAGVAVRRPENVTSVVWMNTAAFLSQSIPLSIASCRVPVFGPFAVLGFNAFAKVATWRAMKKHDRMTKTVKAGYLAPYGNPHDRIATLRFVEDIPLRPSHPSWATLHDIEEKLGTLQEKPVALFWGNADFCFTPAFRKRFEKEFPQAVVESWDDCGHYVVEDAHERILPALRTFLDKHAR